MTRGVNNDRIMTNFLSWLNYPFKNKTQYTMHVSLLLVYKFVSETHLKSTPNPLHSAERTAQTVLS